MDNLDALLNELHQTNVEFLKRTKANSAPSQQNDPNLKKCTETEIDACPPTASSTSTDCQPAKSTSGKTAADAGGGYYYSVNRNTKERQMMPHTLDADLQLGDFSMGRHLSRGDSCSTQPTSFVKEEEEAADYVKRTLLEAEKATKQLDELLESLNKIKIPQQREQSPTGWQTSDVAQPTVSSNGAPAAAAVAPVRSPTGGQVGRPVPAQLPDDQPRAEAIPTAALPRDEQRLPARNPSVMTSEMNHLSKEVQQRGASTAARGVCFACNKPIVGRLVSALNKYWHPEHFACAHCGTGLAQADYYEEDDQAYCAACHRTLFSPKCAYCGEAILQKCIVALSRAWHPEHFFCHHCHNSFNGNVTVNEHENRIYCSICYLNLFATRCSGCKQPIKDTYITALDVPWHRECFVCRECGKVLPGYNFFELDGLAYCELHYNAKRGMLCALCTQPITSRFVSAMGLRYHPEHFLCSYCHKPPPTGTYKEHGNKAYCHSCYAQLFQ